MSLGGPVERPGRLQLVPIPEEGDFGILESGIEPRTAVFGRRWPHAALGATAGVAKASRDPDMNRFWASPGRLCMGLGAVVYRSKWPSGVVVSSQHRPAPVEDARARGYLVGLGRRAEPWGVLSIVPGALGVTNRYFREVSPL